MHETSGYKIQRPHLSNIFVSLKIGVDSDLSVEFGVESGDTSASSAVVLDDDVVSDLARGCVLSEMLYAVCLVLMSGTMD